MKVYLEKFLLQWKRTFLFCDYGIERYYVWPENELFVLWLWILKSASNREPGASWWPQKCSEISLNSEVKYLCESNDG